MPIERPAISLDLMPSFFHKHLGLRFGEAYYFDISHRESVEAAKERLKHELLGRYGVVNQGTRPARNVFVQPVDLVLRTQGATWRFPEDATLESEGTPWAGLEPEEIEAIDARAAASHPVVDLLLDQFGELRRHYGDTADIFGGRAGLMGIHTPYTTAHQLCGEQLFIWMALEPAAAQIVFTKVWRIYEAIFGRVARALGTRFDKVHLGDCSAALISPELYRSCVLPSNQAIARQFGRVGYHSCGASSHLVTAFAELGPLENTQLGPGTDLRAAARALPGTHVQPLVDPLVMRDGSTAQVQAEISAVLSQTAASRAVTLCAWSLDRETPFENLAALYDAVPSVTGT